MIYFQHMDLQGPDLHHAWRAVTGPDVHHEWRAVAVELVAEIHEVKADSIYRIFYIRHVAQGTRVVRLTTTRTVHGTLDYAQGLVRRRGTGSTRSVCVARVERQQRRANGPEGHGT